jgi:predicted Zn-dependent protease
VIPRLFSRFFARLCTRRGAVGCAAALIAVGLLAPQGWAWSRLRSARTALAKHDPAAARTALSECARVWGDRATVRLLACRAAWQDGDPEAALSELRAAQTVLNEATEATAFEWALVQASAGNVVEVEGYLQKQSERSPEAAGPLVWEALALGYLRVYRTLDAMAVLNHWLTREPDNIRALELRGQTFVTGKGVVRGTDDFRRVLELDPTRRKTRRRLAEALVSLGGYEEAVRHWEVFAREETDDPRVPAMLARCYNFVGRGDEARRLLDDALVRHPNDGPCLRTRGQFALIDDQKAEAEGWLRRAAAVMPDDYQAQWLLFEVLRQQGKLEEAKEQSRKADDVKDRVSRLGELQSRKLAEFPLDPALHYEMGTLLMRTGRGDTGEQWLLNALVLDPNHEPSHAALAAYYEGRGDREKAEYHRGRANEGKK